MSSFVFIQNINQPVRDLPRIQLCDSFICRLRGLMFRSHLDRDEGLLLTIGRDSRADSSIHMFFVPFPLAVFWINSDREVVDKVLAQPWRPAYFPAKPARYTLEVHPDRLGDYEAGQKVQFIDA